MRQVILCLLLILFSLVGCSQKEQGNQQDSELTLPQIPKFNVPYKPTNKDIQIALKNTGFYEGNIDGEIGAMSEEAIREFQAANNLAVDGRVGPNTWAVLSKYLK